MNIQSIVAKFLHRGKETVTLSGALIAGALLLGWFTQLEGLSRALMTAAAVVAGIPVALEAWRAAASHAPATSV